MRYVRVMKHNAPVWGVLRGDRIETLSQPPWEGVSYDGGSLPFTGTPLLAPCQPSKIVCVGKNYYDHAMELGDTVPERPILFLKGPNTVNDPEGKIAAPSFVKRLDYEGELAFVIRKRARNVPPEAAGAYILGYTCFNDVTARDVQSDDVQWTRAKTMDGFAPVGPWVTDEVDPADLKVETRLNGAVRQSSRTSKMMHDIPRLLAFITASMTLMPGDVVATGTPAGIGPMVPGDVVEVEIEGVGLLRNTVMEETGF